MDCIVNNKVEIGVQTTKGFMKQGYGKQAVFALIETLFSKGVEQIGWHCMGTNTGSIQIANAIGLKHALSYDFFVPYPPIENIGDLSAVKWAEYAEFYMHQGVKSADQYWVAMKCWANAENLNKVFECIEYLLDSDNKWFINMIPEHEEFTVFEHNTLWKNKLITLMKQDSDG